MWSDPVTRESEVNGGPVEGILLRTGVGEGNNGTSRSSKGVRLSAASDEEALDLGAGGGLDAKGSGVERCIIVEVL